MSFEVAAWVKLSPVGFNLSLVSSPSLAWPPTDCGFHLFAIMHSACCIGELCLSLLGQISLLLGACCCVVAVCCLGRVCVSMSLCFCGSSDVGGGFCVGFNIVSGGKWEIEIGENEVQLSLYFVFMMYPLGLPLPGSPLMFLNPPFLRQATRSCSHPVEKRRDSCGFILTSEEAEVLSIGPTSLKRGEGLFTGWLHVIGR